MSSSTGKSCSVFVSVSCVACEGSCARDFSPMEVFGHIPCPADALADSAARCGIPPENKSKRSENEMEARCRALSSRRLGLFCFEETTLASESFASPPWHHPFCQHPYQPLAGIRGRDR